jgi:hypothetical protein
MRLMDAEGLLSIEAIRRLKSLWCAALDHQDWETLRSLFTAEATVTNSFIAGEPAEMPAARFCAWLAATPEELRSMHHLHNFQVSFDSSTEARGRWEFLAGAWNTATVPSAFKVQYTWGTYLERYAKIGDCWRIAAVTPRWNHQALGTFGAAPPRPPPAKISRAMLATADTASLLAIEEIRQLKARYCSSIDDQDWRALRGVFTDDAAFGVFSGMPIDGPDEFVAFLSQRLTPAATSVHHVHNPLIELTSPVGAKGQWELEYWNWFGGEPLDGGHGFGIYKEHYRRTPGGWRIAALGALPAAADEESHRLPEVSLDIGRASALEEIKALRARVCAAVDGGEWTALANLFTGDASREHEVTDGKTVHHLHNFQAEFMSATEARGRWAVVKFLWRESADAGERIRRIEWGSYRDVYQRAGEGWRIACSRFELIHATEERDRLAAPAPASR